MEALLSGRDESPDSCSLQSLPLPLPCVVPEEFELAFEIEAGTKGSFVLMGTTEIFSGTLPGGWGCFVWWGAPRP
jgi:hypothetical protein